MALSLSSSTISKFLKEGKVFLENESGTGSNKKSSVWTDFSFVYFFKEYTSAPLQYTGYVLCCFCKNPLKHNRSTSGTTHLRDHLTHCSENPVNQYSQKATTSRPITAFFKSTQKLSQLDKKKLLDASVTFIAKDIRPFKAI